MAKEVSTLSFLDAVIDLNDMTLTEYKKEDTDIHDLKKILESIEGVMVSFTIKKANNTVSDFIKEDE